MATCTALSASAAEAARRTSFSSASARCLCFWLMLSPFARLLVLRLDLAEGSIPARLPADVPPGAAPARRLAAAQDENRRGCPRRRGGLSILRHQTHPAGTPARRPGSPSGNRSE